MGDLEEGRGQQMHDLAERSALMEHVSQLQSELKCERAEKLGGLAEMRQLQTELDNGRAEKIERAALESQVLQLEEELEKLLSSHACLEAKLRQGATREAELRRFVGSVTNMLKTKGVHSPAARRVSAYSMDSMDHDDDGDENVEERGHGNDLESVYEGLEELMRTSVVARPGDVSTTAHAPSDEEAAFVAPLETLQRVLSHLGAGAQDSSGIDDDSRAATSAGRTGPGVDVGGFEAHVGELQQVLQGISPNVIPKSSSAEDAEREHVAAAVPKSETVESRRAASSMQVQAASEPNELKNAPLVDSAEQLLMRPVGLGLLSPYSLIGLGLLSPQMTSSIERRATWSAGQFSTPAQPNVPNEASGLVLEVGADDGPLGNHGELEMW